MKILFTGASSFTGYWFVKELAQAGHAVTAIFQKAQVEYSGVRRTRVDNLLGFCEPVFNCSFGDDRFLELLSESKWDLLCHHAADVTDYKSPNFQIGKALANNTRHIDLVLDKLLSAGCAKLVVTGSVFEQNEGIGTEPLVAFSPYGLSKGFTADLFQYHTHLRRMSLGKFVIPNPFGPLEEARFTTYLAKAWLERRIARVSTPLYYRDNIHISLLAKSYLYFVNQMMNDQPSLKCSPSGYRETQREFAERFANAMRGRLNVPCELDFAVQTEFQEPLQRVNAGISSSKEWEWDEDRAWDDLAVYYKEAFQGQLCNQ